MITDRLQFVKSICIDDISNLFINYFDQLMLLYDIMPKCWQYNIIKTTANDGILEINMELADTSTALWFKSILENQEPYILYGRSLTVKTILNNCNLLIRVY